ncbi:MAG: sigma factor-like helix-turn-helix DNA-binding protein, partial [Planctomycetota bacterium]|nr:sigma factor-like helix-turn-helix DNA-binding protein [Planctomycetota bacterium]
HYLDGMGIAEIAVALDIPAGTVKSRLYHARQQLKELLERTES